MTHKSSHIIIDLRNRVEKIEKELEEIKKLIKALEEDD